MSNNILSFLDTEIGIIFVSILLGLGLASLFRKTCTDNNFIIVKGPPLKQMENKIYGFDDKCYKYKAVATSCKNNKCKEGSCKK